MTGTEYAAPPERPGAMAVVTRSSARVTRRLALHFACVLGALWVVPFPLDRLPYVGARVDAASSWVWDAVVPVFARHVLRLTNVTEDATNGSGDTLFDWSCIALWIVIAAVAAPVWSLVERAPSPTRDARVREWLHVALRYRLAAVMFTYGFAKVFNTQFPVPKPTNLLVSYGESSPHGLLWRFMGASRGYTFFGGALECLGAALLLTRRTTTLGAPLLVAVLTNVVMLNLCYDVPVKLYSALYLGVALFLVGPDVGRITEAFVFHRPVAGRRFTPHFRRRAARVFGYAAKSAVIGLLVIRQGRTAYLAWSPTHGDILTPEIAGTYTVDSLRIGDDALPTVGERVALQRGFFALRHPDGSRTSFAFALDVGAQRLVGDDGSVLRYQGDGHPELSLEGTIDGATYALTLRRLPQPLLEHDFHWVMEHPFYR